MKHIQWKLTVGRITALLMLAGGLTMTFQTGAVAEDELSSGDILDKVRANYATLVTYSDVGKVVVSLNGNDTTSSSFDIRLARPNFYRVRWLQAADSSNPLHAPFIESVWSSGALNHLQTDYGVQEEDRPEMTLRLASCLSAGTTAAVPLIFFNSHLGDPLGDLTFENLRQADEQLGKVDCYVITRVSLRQRKTFWIGKGDFLIRQIQTVVGEDGSVLPEGKLDWQTRVGLHLVTFTETHGNILVNQPLKRSDFNP